MENKNDCCNTKQNSGIKSYIIPATVLLILIVSVIQSFQIISIKESINKDMITGSATSNGAIDTSGWTEDEKMMYEHHGTLPARSQKGSTTGKANMVGGC